MKIYVCDHCKKQSEPQHGDIPPQGWWNLYIADNQGGRIVLTLCPECVAQTSLTRRAIRSSDWEDTFREFVYECIDERNDP